MMRPSRCDEISMCIGARRRHAIGIIIIRPCQKAPTNGRPAPQSNPANDSRALVRVDGTGIRNKIKKDYEKALRDLENSRRQLDQFQQTDQPQFTRWLNTHFGALLTERAVAALGVPGASAESYGKAAAVGENGELEHAAAILHPKLGTPVRKTLGKGAALIPSSKKRGGPGVALDIPLGHKDAAFVRSHFDGMEIRINDAPRANEIVVAIAVTDSGRPLPRVGGLTKDQIKGEDGLR